MDNSQGQGGQSGRVESAIVGIKVSAFDGFLNFIRERGVAGFAIGFIFGGAAQALVKALMDDIISPFAGLFLGRVGSLAAYQIGDFKIGDFISQLINFIILCFVIYFLFKVLNLEKLDKPKVE